MRKLRFTLIELLAAMAVFLVLMAIVFSFFSTAQMAWSTTDTNTRIYENARVALDLISRDLQCAIASNEPGREIPFYYAAYGSDFDPTQWNKRVALYFVTIAPPTTAAKTRICEIGYQLYTGALASHTDNRYWLRRSRTCDSDGAKWNFYGVAAAPGFLAPGSGWTDIGTSGAQKVIPGVENLRFDLFPASTWNSTGTRNELPKAVRVTITLFDPKLMNVPDAVRNAKINKSKRTFSKLIFLPARGLTYK